MHKYLVFILLPIIVNIILFIVPLKEKSRYGYVTYPKSVFLYFPSTAVSIAFISIVLNFSSYLQTHDNAFFKTICIMLVIIVFSVVLLIYYIFGKIKYTNEKFIYRRKEYSFSDIETTGTDKNNNCVYVLKSGKKIKVDVLCPGQREFYKTYKEYKKTQRH